MSEGNRANAASPRRRSPRLSAQPALNVQVPTQALLGASAPSGSSSPRQVRSAQLPHIDKVTHGSADVAKQVKALATVTTEWGRMVVQDAPLSPAIRLLAKDCWSGWHNAEAIRWCLHLSDLQQASSKSEGIAALLDAAVQPFTSEELLVKIAADSAGNPQQRPFQASGEQSQGSAVPAGSRTVPATPPRASSSSESKAASAPAKRVVVIVPDSMEDLRQRLIIATSALDAAKAQQVARDLATELKGHSQHQQTTRAPLPLPGLRAQIANLQRARGGHTASEESQGQSQEFMTAC
jgi:hypothetical protein